MYYNKYIYGISWISAGLFPVPIQKMKSFSKE